MRCGGRPPGEDDGELREYFDQKARSYDEHVYLSGTKDCYVYNQQRRRDFFRRLIRGLRDGEASPGLALDIGSGPGTIAQELRSRGFRTHCIDLSFGMLLQNRENNGEEVSLAQCSADALCYRDDSFDVVTAAGVLEYVPDDRRVLHEILRVVRPGGTLIISVPVREWLFWLRKQVVTRVAGKRRPHFHHKRYTPIAFRRQLEEAGFSVKATVAHQFVFFPFDYLFPELSTRLDRALTRRLSGSSRFALFGKTFIVEATKP
jgi:ubiquinone/menaquinone biosynthesis C-methylase UbiE